MDQENAISIQIPGRRTTEENTTFVKQPKILELYENRISVETSVKGG
jgi:hypothetical protein